MFLDFLRTSIWSNTPVFRGSLHPGPKLPSRGHCQLGRSDPRVRTSARHIETTSTAVGLEIGHLWWKHHTRTLNCYCVRILRLSVPPHRTQQDLTRPTARGTGIAVFVLRGWHIAWLQGPCALPTYYPIVHYRVSTAASIRGPDALFDLAVIRKKMGHQSTSISTDTQDGPLSTME
ncbi:hypothetical protein CPAR01_03606 [Colletotrichum paranaense]|uniref:Uncharacterized protein n=1 Tax=Colletotrichum paranaense TaxID=1914294 RepID=A0ABQ9STW6_9PEZI|nr:uncharacterized protein CPAR01_03606 [Colletotrichum paranaense]KAK1542973.1 hypothetical protein CPAR01_03606 [Colletotrichum paranaense]